VPERVSYEYAVVRVVPRVDRDEFVNAGVIVFAKQQMLLAARTCLDIARLQALWPAVDIGVVRRHLDAVERVCQGDTDAGPIAKMSQSERFHWLTSPRSTVIQVSPVRTGLVELAELRTLVDHLSRELVETG
jgi:Protein of unknown function (DUF3037)